MRARAQVYITVDPCHSHMTLSKLVIAQFRYTAKAAFIAREKD